MKELWIHMGLPKNGSSAIQVFLAQNIINLKKEDLNYIELNDINNAKRGEISSGNAVLLARSLLSKSHEAYFNDNKLYELFLKLLKKNNNKKVLLSSEFFAIVPITSMKKIKEDVEKIGFQLKLIFYVRRQDQFLMSSYMQRVKRHKYTGYPEDFVLENYKNIHFLKYYGYTNEYINLLGKENIYTNIYELTKEVQEGIVGDFIISILGYIPSWVKSIKSINTSPSIMELKFMLINNNYSPRMEYSDFLISDSIFRNKSYKYQKHNILSKKLTNQIHNYFEEQNNRFCNEILNGKNFPEFKDEEFVNIKDLSFNLDEVTEIISGFLVRYDRRLTKLETKVD